LPSAYGVLVKQDTQIQSRRFEGVAYSIALVDVVIVGVWFWDASALPSQRLLFDYGRSSYYPLLAGLMMLGCLGSAILFRVGRAEWRRPSSVSLWIATVLVLVPVGFELLLRMLYSSAFDDF
jgi:hypothetical protein